MTGLDENEQKEMKALQEERKDSGGHLTDSQRLRLSELQGKAEEAKPEAGLKSAETKPAASATKK